MADETCASCGRPLERGDRFHEVNTPDGAKPVHVECLEGGRPQPALRSLDGDQVETVPRARRKAPPRPESLPRLYAEGKLRPVRELDRGSAERKVLSVVQGPGERAAGSQLDLGAPFRRGPGFSPA